MIHRLGQCYKTLVIPQASKLERFIINLNFKPSLTFEIKERQSTWVLHKADTPSLNHKY